MASPPVRYPIVLLDVGETLLGPSASYGAVYAGALRAMGIDVDVVGLDRAIREAVVELSRGLPPGGDRFGRFPGGESAYWLRFVGEVFRRTTGREAGAGFCRELLGRLWDAFGRRAAWRVYDDTVPALRTLRRDGARLGVVSNWDSRLPALLETLGLADFFEVVVVSHLEGVEKPDPRIFHRVLERLGADARQALHVGNDRALDVGGARAAGVDAVLLDRQREAGPSRTAVIRDLRELPPLARRGLG